MKKCLRINLLPVIFLVSLTFIFSCKGKKTSTDGQAEVSTDPGKESKPASETKTYTVTSIPDSVLLGKNKEAVIKIENIKAVQLSNPDGENTGAELTYDIEVTNNNKVGGASVYVNPNDFRLVLDNGTKLTHELYNTVSADAESTKISTDNKFKLPPGTKPTALNLFFDETSASVKLEVK